MTGLLLHLSGPLQSWGTNSPWNRRDTHTHPTRSGLIGLLAAAEGRQRGEPLDDYDAVEFTIRIDRPGTVIEDFHTVGGGRSREETPPLAAGGRRPLGKGTVVSKRHYLTDAVFTVAVTDADTDFLDTLAAKLAEPVYTLHLGRRSCPPTAPLYLGSHQNPVLALHKIIPLNRTPPRSSDNIAIDFITEHPTDSPTQTSTTPTRPTRFGPQRSHQQHTTWTTSHQLPAHLCAGNGSDYLHALTKLKQKPDAS
jgi:CRISPR system Cascade subunit CasD